MTEDSPGATPKYSVARAYMDSQYLAAFSSGPLSRISQVFAAALRVVKAHRTMDALLADDADAAEEQIQAAQRELWAALAEWED